jgi:N-methylhydantoinase A
MDRVLVPTGAGVGSAIGFLRAPIAYEIVRSRLQRLSQFDAEGANAMFAEMREEAEKIVREGAPDAALEEERVAFMRYKGQGHEVMVPLPARPYAAGDARTLTEAFETAYRVLYSRVIPGVDVEVVSWALRLAAPAEPYEETAASEQPSTPKPAGTRRVFDPGTGDFVEAALFHRPSLRPGARIVGPAVIAEDETSTVVSPSFEARVNGFGYIELLRK